MEFDTATLSPTYRFMQGVPGRSNAFEIARRLGLNEIIVKEAENLTDTDSDVNRIIEQLEAQTVETQKRLEHIKDVEQENLKFNRAVKKLYNEFSHEYDKELEKAQKEIQDMLIPLWLRAIVFSKISMIRVNSSLMKLSTPKENSRNLPHKWTSLRIKSFVRPRKKRLRVPLMSEMISSLPPMVNVVRLPVKPKMVTGKPR